MRSGKIVVWVLSVMFYAAFHSAEADEVSYKMLPKFGVAIGERFPLEKLTDSKGRLFDEKRTLGKNLLINFYTQYCAPCIKEVPKLNQVMARHADLNVLAITTDSGTSADDYVSKYGLNWPVAANAESLLFKDLNVVSFPAFAILDAQGRLVATVQANQLGGEDGHATVEGIEAWIAKFVPKPIE